MKKIIFTAIAVAFATVTFAQTIDMNFSPLKTSLGKTVLDVVQIVCFVFFVGGIIGAAWQHDKQNQEAFKGFVYVVVLTLIIGGGATAAKLAFLQ